MVYMGSKARIADDILGVIKEVAEYYKLENYYEPFCGGCAVAEKVVENTYLNVECSDVNNYLIALFKYVASGEFKEYVPIYKEQYDDIRSNIGTGKYPDWYTAYCGFCCSYRGRWMSGHSPVDASAGRFYQVEHYNNLVGSEKVFNKIKFSCRNYWEIGDIKDSIVYCDAPYKNTYGYIEKDFDYPKYYKWLKELAKNNFVIVSEYMMPRGFKEVKSFVLSSCIGGVLEDQPNENLYIVDGGKYTGIFNTEIDISDLI